MLIAATISGAIAIYAATGMKASTGYLLDDQEIFITQPFAGGITSTPLTISQIVQILDGVDSAIMILTVTFWAFASISIFFVAFYIFKILKSKRSTRNLTLASGLILCPFCAEEILPEAKICKHCQRDLAAKD